MKVQVMVPFCVMLAASAAVAGVEEEIARPAIPASPEVVARAASLRLGHAEVVRFGQPVGTVIVGDSGIIDVTAVNDQTVVLTALTVGTTNVVVLDEEAEVLSRLNVHVRVPQDPKAEVYRGRERTVLVCNPNCVPVNEAPAAREGGAEAAVVSTEPPEVAEDGATAEAEASPEPREAEPSEPAE